MKSGNSETNGDRIQQNKEHDYCIYVYLRPKKKKKSEIDWWSRIKLGNRLRCNKDKMTLQITGKEWAIQ